MDSIWAYLGLAASAFTSATILPGTSEAAFVLFIRSHPSSWPSVLAVAGLANSLGSMVSYCMGRLLPARKRPSEKILSRLDRYGVWALFFAWLPIIGDGLPLAAGWLRLDALKSCIVLTAGKFFRYGLILAGLETWV